MNPFWVAAAIGGLGAFLFGLVRAAWSGQNAAGRWQPGAWRWWALAAAGLLVMAIGLHLAGVEPTGLHYPQDVDVTKSGG